MKKIKVLLLTVALFLTGCNEITKTPKQWSQYFAIQEWQETYAIDMGAYTTSSEQVFKGNNTEWGEGRVFIFLVELKHITPTSEYFVDIYTYVVFIEFELEEGLKTYFNDFFGRKDIYKQDQIIGYEIVEIHYD